MNNDIKKYFDENSELWINDAYDFGNYNYPVGLNRLRILKKILKDFSAEGKTLLDIGCGGGDISINMAMKGFNVIGVDMSKTMIDAAEERKSKLGPEFAKKIKFKHISFDNISEFIKKQSIDVIVAFGFIGYLENDNIFFEKCNELLNESGKLIISCRNRLFNMKSISNYTIKEIENNNALNLVNQINKLYNNNLPEENVIEFIENLKKTINSIDLEQIRTSIENGNDKNDNPIATLNVDARQHTLEEIIENSSFMGFENIKNYGVHPHLIEPKMNKMLPRQIFNRLSDSLCVFEELPISLTWSSVFISEFEKVKDKK